MNNHSQARNIKEFCKHLHIRKTTIFLDLENYPNGILILAEKKTCAFHENSIEQKNKWNQTKNSTNFGPKTSENKGERRKKE